MSSTTSIKDLASALDVLPSTVPNAHLTALHLLMEHKNADRYEVFNLGTGQGSTVLKVKASFEHVWSNKLNYKIVSRQRGDVVAAYTLRGWKTLLNMDQAIV